MENNNNLKNILLCDDNVLNRKLIAAMITGLPYSFMEAANGRESLARVLSDHDSIDLVLLDIGMKDFSGIEVCRAIRRSEQDRKRPLPIIAYTAHAMVNERAKYFAVGFNDILTKPTMREDLFEILRKYVS